MLANELVYRRGSRGGVGVVVGAWLAVRLRRQKCMGCKYVGNGRKCLLYRVQKRPLLGGSNVLV